MPEEKPVEDDIEHGWLTHYDGPARRLVVMHVPGRWERLQLCPELEHPLLRLSREADDPAGPMLALHLELDEHGKPRAWPGRLHWSALGSPTLWPGPNRQYLWRNRELITTDGWNILDLPAHELGPVEPGLGFDGAWPSSSPYQMQPSEPSEEPSYKLSEEAFDITGLDLTGAYTVLAGEGEAIRAYDDPHRGLWLLLGGGAIELPDGEVVGGSWARRFDTPQERENFLVGRYGRALASWRSWQSQERRWRQEQS